MTAAVSTDREPVSSTPRYTVKVAPVREPPFDDEVPPRHLTVVGPLDQRLPFVTPNPDTVSRLRQATRSDPFALRPTGRDELPDPALFARRFVIAVIETAAGRRPVSHLGRHTAPAVQAGLARTAGQITRLGTAQRPATLHSVHFTEPADGVAEVAAVVRIGDRFRAIALRLEGLDGRWRCVRLQIG